MSARSTAPREPPPRRRRVAPTRLRRLAFAAAVLVAVAAVVASFVSLLPDGGEPVVFHGTTDPVTADFRPFAYSAQREETLIRRATAGHAHPVYALAPGGPLAAARRTARYRDAIERATRPYDVNPDMLEAMVLLESAGRPEVIAGDDPEAAAGLTQILAATGRTQLGMDIDLARSRRLTRAIARAEKRGDKDRARRLRARRRQVDERFDPHAALDGAARYLAAARRRFARDDLAVVSYHMGFGNLETVLRMVADEQRERPVAELVADHGLSWARVYFGTSPRSDADAFAHLQRLGDDSPTYYWRVLAARDLMERWRTDPESLEDQAKLYRGKPSAEDALHPPGTTEVYDDPEELEQEIEEGDLVPLPSGKALGLRVSRGVGELAARLDREPDLYRYLRPEAAALLIHIARQVQVISGARQPLVVASAVVDREYLDVVTAQNIESMPGYSTDTTGYGFEIARRYASDAQAEALQFQLDRLTSLNVIAWSRRGDVIDVTVSRDAAAYLPLLAEAGYEGIPS